MKSYKALGCILLLLVMVLVPLTSALQMDNGKVDNNWKKELKQDFKTDKLDLKYNDLWKDYKPITIENWKGLGKKLFEGALTEHTRECVGDYCYSIMEIYTSGDDAVVDDIIFKTEQEDGSWVNQDVRRYNLQYWGLINDYEYQCKDSGKKSENGTKEQTCTNEIVGNHEGYINLGLGQKLPEGNYKIKLEAWKKPSRTVDWIIKTNGIWLESWAVWGADGYSYQEDINGTYAEGAGWTDITNAFDGNWGTSADASGDRSVTFSYIKPEYATSALWQIKDTQGEANLTVSQTCWDYNSTHLFFRVQINQPQERTYWYCNSGTDEQLRQSTASGDARFYEEGIYWYNDYSDVTLNSPSDASISDTNNVQFNATSSVSGGATLTNMSLWTDETGSWAVRNSTAIDVETFFEAYSYYKLDETSGTVLDSAGSNDGTNVGATTNVAGIIDTAYEFTSSSTDRITITDSGTMSPQIGTDEFSISAWFYDTSTIGSRDTIVQNRNGINANFGYEIAVFPGASDTIQFSDAYGNSLTGPTILENNWYNVVLIANTTHVSMYLNGSLVDQDTITPASTKPNSGGLNIGSWYGGGGWEATNSFDGKIDEVAYFDKTLTETEVFQIYNSGAASRGNTTTSTQTWNRTITDDIIWNVQACDSDGDCSWGLEDTVSDSAGSNDGTISGGAIFTPTGIVGEGAMQFDGVDDYVNTNLDAQTLFEYDKDYTVTGWFKANHNSTDATKIIFGSGNGTQSKLTLGWDYGRLRSRYRNGADSSAGASYESYLNPNEWYHFAFTYDGTGTLYLDNVEGTGNEPINSVGTNKVTIGSRNDGVGNFNGSIDDVRIYNRSLTVGEISDIYTQSSPTSSGLVAHYDFEDLIETGVPYYSLSIDTTAPSIDILYPSGTLSTLVDGQNVSLNYTITDTNIDTCWYSYNGTNVTTPCVLNSSFLYNFGENSITLWANDSVGNVGSDTQSWGVGILENSQTFNNETVEGSIENFYANVTLDPSLEITQADLIYNGTTVSGTFLSDGQIRLLSVENYEIPSFVSDSNATFYWSLTLTSGVIVNLSTQTQFVGVIGLDNCSTYTNQLFNISLFDERAKTPINGTIELYYQVQNVPTYTTIKNLTGKFENVHNTLVCSDLNLTAQNLAYSAEIRYTSNEYAPELYHIQRAVISPETVNVNLYDLNSSASTEFKITYQDDTFNFVEGAILQLRRRYISEDAYEVVEAPLTSNEGIAVLHIDLDSVKYAATVTKNGVVLDTFNNLVFKCQSILTGECEQKLLGNIDPQNTIDYDTERDFAYTVTPGDNNVTISYTIPSSAPSSVNMVLTQKDQFGNTTQCNKTVVSSGGSIQCTYDDTLDVSYLELVITKDGVPMSFNTYVSDASTGSAFFDNNYIIVVVLMLSLVGMALSSPEWIMLNGIMTLLLSGMLWLVNGVDFVAGLGILMWLVIAAGIIILKLSKQEDR